MFEVKNLSSFDKGVYKKTGAIPAKSADMICPGAFSKGYFATLARRGKIRGFRVGGKMFVDLKDTINFLTPKSIKNEGNAENVENMFDPNAGNIDIFGAEIEPSSLVIDEGLGLNASASK